ncbi:hypothetical protein VNO78_01283 [Psophocarpus tetragonolobus]|uniref:G domain-containing protein n=1 Tax=Psophocarpus tetragonolobus TaxID=3891 RepID=A0AAN9XUL7_PSOTE
MIVDTSRVITISKPQAIIMEELAISTTIGMDGIPLAVRELVIARMPLAGLTADDVGKSNMLNALVGEDRTIASTISGTTYDAIDTEFTGPNGQAFSVNQAFHAIRRSDVVALVIEVDALDKLEAFTSFNGPDFYGLPRSKLKIKLRKAPWKVPNYFSFPFEDIVPMYAGETLE